MIRRHSHKVESVFVPPIPQPQRTNSRRQLTTNSIPRSISTKVLHCKAFRNECVCGGCDKLPLDLRYHRNKDIITDFLAEVREQVDQEITPQVLLKAGFVSDRIRNRSAVNGCDDLEASIRHMVFNKYFEDFAGDVLDFLQARVHLALSKESNRIFKRSLIYRAQVFVDSFKKKKPEPKVEDTLPRSANEIYTLNKLTVNLAVVDRIDLVDDMERASKFDIECLKYLHWLLEWRRKDFFYPDPPPYVDPRCSADTPRPSRRYRYRRD
ncbi:hypothetical protein E3P92_02489 [Wallemia ichthyophaga]|uniref:Uncharacterized protein n=1 Tax=Wallemia ichthyophaga TaxID=245174 RepID=A0A4T0GAZ0_WALIC|nr:hypothetical protein E3P91_02501 [Wallemia ichthyophaga]TIA82283.1 hypothetical protein E3P98_01472 [Wallemia ichthyophaga]TIA99009.1 hypothetical protein E3P95_02211 [Wallemia ichthyophaga]TIB00148.1 hypothetical protein E3P94_02268 [Wallemia ichthyophaga]TIB11400.1 hypothetical protein E3P90_02445 [Wallemia ichthyophaga]